MEPRKIKLKEYYDLIIIGGGIYGSALMSKASSKGINTILIEKSDFCSQTSANSLKIIHGGLRYIQNMDFKRAKDSYDNLVELLSNYPHLVKPLSCAIPTERSIFKSKLAILIGFQLYRLIQKLSNSNEHLSNLKNRLISKKELSLIIKDLITDAYTGGAIWFDGLNLNAERLVLENIYNARDSGADAFNYLRMEDLILDKKKVKGITARDMLNGKNYEIFGDCVINATGQWFLEILKQIGCETSTHKDVHFIKGANLIISEKYSDYAFGLKLKNFNNNGAANNKFLFFVPIESKTLIGTWYFRDQKVKSTFLSETETQFCIDQIRDVFPKINVTADRIEHVHIGWLPAISKNISADYPVLCNKPIIIDHHKEGNIKGLITVIGVKFTTAMSVAANIINYLEKKKYIRKNYSLYRKTRTVSKNPAQKKIEEKVFHTLPEKVTNKLEENYGNKTNQLLNAIYNDPEKASLVPGTNDHIIAELEYSSEEDVYYLSDLIVRRTGIGKFEKPSHDTIQFCADFLGRKRSWSEARKQAEISELTRYYNRYQKK
jgi:glycerol-3-phosphate dehydrogenase